MATATLSVAADQDTQMWVEFVVEADVQRLAGGVLVVAGVYLGSRERREGGIITGSPG